MSHSGIFYTYENEPTPEEVLKILSTCGREVLENSMRAQRTTCAMVYPNEYKCFSRFNKKEKKWEVGVLTKLNYTDRL